MSNAIINIINPESFELQDYSLNDQNLVPSFITSSAFNIVENVVEVYIYDINQSLLDYENDYRRYSLIQEGNSQGFDILNSITVDPERDLVDFGFDQGEYNIIYNFFDNKIGSSFNTRYFIKEISPSRQEIRLASNDLTNGEIESGVNEFISEREASSYFKDFQLNFGNNIQYIANNILLDNTNPNQYTVLIKLYEPIPGNISLGDTLWVCEETAEPLGFNLVFPPEEIIIQEGINLRGPNLNIDIRDQVNNSTGLIDFTTLTTTALTSSYNQLNTLFEEKGIEINVDYTDFSNFIHFSSAEQRIRNFYYKVGLIESLQNDINSILTITGSTSASVVVTGSISTLEGQITNIIENFDGFDYYMYYEFNSIAYPKSNSKPPYILQSTGSAGVLTWLNNRIVSASDYDNTNQNALVYTIPEYLRDDPQNAPYELFVEMVGQHFDNLYLYTKDITNLHNADNRLEYGISKDLVADALRSFGIKLYENNFTSNDLYSGFVGINGSGSFLPPTGSEIIDNYITASNNPIPLDDVNKEVYKRIYHNLPYLLKRKGTIEGVRALINCYGIPDTVLRISEFGGKDRDNTDDYDYWYNRYSYTLDTRGTDRIDVPWTASSAEFGGERPKTIMFRFKTDGIPPTSHASQSLLVWSDNSETNNIVGRFNLRLTYTGSYFTSESYSGSIPSQSNEYGDLTFRYFNSDILNINAPFFNGDWWSIMIQTGSGNFFRLYAKQNIYNGEDGDQLGYEFSSSITNPGNGTWDNPSYTRILLGGTTTAVSNQFPSNSLFLGSLQELRFYNTPISESVFNDFVMNPTSIEGNNITGSFTSLIFRAPLGNELLDLDNSYLAQFIPINFNPANILLPSIHPAIDPSADILITQSFSNGSSIYTASLNIVEKYAYRGSHMKPTTEVYYLDQPVVGIKNRISNKIRNENTILPSDQNTTLSPFRSIQQFDTSNESYTRDINLLEVAFSPQNEINDDIIASLGYFNIGEYIGDPRQVSESVTSYPDLVKLNEEHFKKYHKSYDLVDYVRLIKYFDNSLFKMIKDFVPARTSLTTGVVIKQHLLERNKYRQPQMSYTQPEYSASIKSGFIEGGTGGALEPYNNLNISPWGIASESLSNIYNLTQSWVESIIGPSGSVNIIQNSQKEFYNGEFSGSTLLVTDGELNDENTFKYPSTLEISYDIIFYTSSVTPLEVFNNINTSPNSGQIYLWYDTGSILNTGEGLPPIAEFIIR